MASYTRAPITPHPLILRKLRAAYYLAVDRLEKAAPGYSRAVAADDAQRALDRLLLAAGVGPEPTSERPTVRTPTSI